MNSPSRKRYVYRAVVTEVPGEQPVPMLVQMPSWDTADGRIRDEHRVSVPFNGDLLWFVPVECVHPWNGDPDANDPVRWFAEGQSRSFLSRKGAEHKAAIWRAHGCKVRVDKSDPVIWHEGEPS